MAEKSSEFEETLDTLNSPGVMLIFAFVMVSILMAQDAWRTISGLYFTGSEFILMAYFVVFIYKLSRLADESVERSRKLNAMTVGFLLLYVPAMYLAATGQLDFHGVIFSEFNPSLNHLPYAQVLPFIAIMALFVPDKRES